MLPKEGDDANAFSSGRIHIWQTYAKGFNFIGNSADAATPISPEIYHLNICNITYFCYIVNILGSLRLYSLKRILIIRN